LGKLFTRAPAMGNDAVEKDFLCFQVYHKHPFFPG
jgi:hypothetical protein